MYAYRYLLIAPKMTKFLQLLRFTKSMAVHIPEMPAPMITTAALLVPG
jgi:hypothetical protein